ncbi:MAG: 1-acyl-sn-glycerol-3-phosphate acyltransferase [Alphaproteobacteria bacterium]|nr:1-acyl-sn-glycerol-3-phosphate acyltransferase [Alphaproteobacteria bacterium]
MGSSALAFFRSAVYIALTLPLMPVQALFVALGLPFARTFPHWYHARCAKIFGLDIRVTGAPASDVPVLIASNHVSYLDIIVYSSILPVSFVAKREVAAWPFFGMLAKLQRTVFVERRPRAVGRETGAIQRRLAAGDNVVLFAEGTTGDGNRALGFKSALFAAAEPLEGGPEIVVQPATIAYTRLDGMPLCRSLRPAVAWYGDMELLPHLWALIGLGRIGVEVVLHAPTTLAVAGSRKALAQHCEEAVGRTLAAANAGRETPPIPALYGAVGAA